MSTDPQPAPKSFGDFWARNKAVLWPLVMSLVSSLLTAVLLYIGVSPRVVEVLVNIPVPVSFDQAPALDEFSGRIDKHGWRPDAEASAKDAAEVAFRTFADTPAGQVAANELPKQMFLWQAETKLTGKPTPLKDQNPEGSCTGFGGDTAVERSLAADIVARNGHPSEFTHFSEEVVYIGGRNQGAVAAGGQPMNPRSQGSAGVYVKAFVTTYGMVPKAKYASADLTEYSATRAAQWRSSGLPKELVEVAKKYPVKGSAKVANWKECKAALASGYGVSICSTLSFARQRDANGVAGMTREGWNHCMCIDGYYVDANGKEYGHVENSWTNLPDNRGNRTGQAYHTGPTGWGNPTTAGFWATSEAIDSGLRQGESYAFSGATGFPAKVLPLDWFVRAQDRAHALPKELLTVRAPGCPGVALAW